MSKTNKILYLIVTVAFFVMLNIYFTNLMLNSIIYKLPQNNFVNLVSVQNTGAAFSILENSQTFLVSFAVLAILFVVVYIIKNINNISVFCIFWIALLLSGILCNTLERISLGYVRDFFSINFIDFPVFNISDIFINIGVIAVIIIIIKNKYLKK